MSDLRLCVHDTCCVGAHRIWYGVSCWFRPHMASFAANQTQLLELRSEPVCVRNRVALVVLGAVGGPKY